MFLIVGGDSEIGAATYRTLKAQGQPVAATTRRRERVAADRPFLDLALPLESWEPPRQTKAACVCAAVARIAACAADPAGTAFVNVNQTLTLIDRLLARGIYVLFLSTNQVFDGRVPHVPADAPHSPVSEYGRQKARTETALRVHMARGAPAAILRLAKVVSSHLPLIEDWTADLAAGKLISAFNDMTLAPTPTALVCSAVIALMQDRVPGVFQLTGPRDVRYAEVGRFLARRLGVSETLVIETSAAEAGISEGSTPYNTTLDSSRLRERYGLDVPDIWQMIAPMVESHMRRTGDHSPSSGAS
jgi:dTDP-4-dehydrorhamnose reductase